MSEFLNTDEKNEEIERLVELLSEDAARLFVTMERAITDNTLIEEGRALLQTERASLAKVAETVLARLASLEARLPRRQSLFRDYGDSVRMYRAIVPFLSALDEQIRGLRASVLFLSGLRERVLRASMELMRLEWYCRALLGRAELDVHRKKLVQLLEEITHRASLQDTVRKEIEECSFLWRQFDTHVMLPFLENMKKRSDAEHDGASCDCTGVVALLGELKRETGKLL